MHNIVIYGKDGCIFCDMARELAESKSMKIVVKKLGRDFTVEEFTSLFPYATTVPQIVLDEKHIGGYQDLNNLV